MAKSVDPASGTAVAPGQTLTYTLKFANDGTAEAPVDFVDLMADVLDDATLVEDSITAEEPLTAQLGDQRLAITGSVPAGETRTVTYQVTVNAADALGDQQLGNFVVPADPENPGTEQPPAECEEGSQLCTENPVPLPNLDVAKSVDPASGTAVAPGQTLTYTLKFANDGTAEAPVDFVDLMADVLDDATLVEDSITAEEPLTAQLGDQRLAITGSVPAGETRTVTYQVTVNAADALGDQQLGNFVVPADPENPGTEQPPAECEEGSQLCTENPVPLPNLDVAKSVDPASGTAVAPGQTLTYTLKFANDGTAEAPVDFVDLMADVLDDATLVEDSITAEEPLTAQLGDQRLAITGSVPAGKPAP
ncbi:hypothetical protein SLW73_17180 [Glutamicibacter protophormiae]|uniref:DUF7927 domain-containing protein n=1 Tax=Glutamicibacter protophormiae TaxID=37930 RepID=UPI002A80BABC|nr:hypothetical protein [Glutamicibacter protophormiae]WPR68095.1 hypothetical protein SLW73_17180 [Glutamicibacter protophormiae]